MPKQKRKMEQFKIKRKVLIEEEVDWNIFIAHKIRENRQRVGMNQTELGEKLGLTRTSMTNIELGRQRLSIENLYLLCKFFGVKSNTFLPF